MPFTISHAAAVLPLVRGPLPASALVVGSMVPDLPYFVPGLPGRSTTHDALGILVADVPIGLLVLAVWHLLLVPPLLALVPVSRGAGPPQPASRRVLLVVVGLALGAATHVLWDSFTHPGGWGVERVRLLEDPLGPLAGYRWAQYASSALGLAVVLAWCVREWRRQPAEVQSLPVQARLLGVVTVVTVVAAVLGATLGALAQHDGPRSAGFGAVTAGGSAAGATLLLAAGAWHVRRWATRS